LQKKECIANLGQSHFQAIGRTAVIGFEKWIAKNVKDVDAKLKNNEVFDNGLGLWGNAEFVTCTGTANMIS
jgi:hypothetical protein